MQEYVINKVLYQSRYFDKIYGSHSLIRWSIISLPALYVILQILIFFECFGVDLHHDSIITKVDLTGIDNFIC